MQNAVADGRTIKEIRMASQNQLKYIREYNKAHYDRITAKKKAHELIAYIISRLV